MIDIKDMSLNSTNSSDSTPKKSKAKKQNFLLGIVIVLTLIALLFTVYFSAQLVKIENEDSNTGNNNNSDSEIVWEIERIQANSSNSQNFDLTLMSNAGQLRTYSDVSSFGLSKNGETLALNSLKGLEIVELEDDSRHLITPPLEQFAGDSGNAISWNFDSKYFALSIVNTKSTVDTRIWIFDVEGQLVKEIQTLIPVVQTSKAIVEPIEFSKFNNAILARTYKAVDSTELKEDGTNYSYAELPVYLSAFDIEGMLIKDINVRDFDTSGSQVYFTWDNKSQKLIKYGLFAKGEEIDPSLEYKFIKVSI